MHPVLALFRRNAWATGELLRFCAGLPSEVVERSDPDVYGSIVALFNHIVGAEHRYLSRLGPTPEPPVNEREPRTLAELIPAAAATAAIWEERLGEDRDPEALREHMRNDRRSRMPDWLMFVQAVHHGDDHRTQVSTLLGRQGIEAPNLDGWEFGDLPQNPGEISAAAQRLLPRFLGHHLWATDQVIRWAVRLGRERTEEATADGTYGTLRATLKHLIFADREYLAWLEQPDWSALVESERDFDRRVGSEDAWSPAWAIAVQAIHHGNDHRTHIGTVSLANDLGAPDVDVWSYALAEGAYSED